jgi:biopolymer transport protein ExbD
VSTRLKQKKRNRAGKHKLEDVPMTPMIDVVFQMLIYFVFTFEIPHRITEMKVWRPQAPKTQSTENITTQNITIYRAGANQSPYTLNDRGVTLESMRNYIYSLADNDPTQTIVVKATSNSYHKDLVALLNLLSDAGLQNISLFSAQ